MTLHNLLKIVWNFIRWCHSLVMATLLFHCLLANINKALTLLLDQVWSILPALELVPLDHSYRRQKGNSFACDVNSRGGPTPMRAKWIKLDVLSSHGLRLVEKKLCPLLELNANKQRMRHAVRCWQGRCIFENLNGGLALVPVFVLFRIWVEFNNHLSFMCLSGSSYYRTYKFIKRCPNDNSCWCEKKHYWCMSRQLTLCDLFSFWYFR